MNHRQKLVQKQFLNNEEAVIKRLDQVYRKSLSDVQDKIKNLQFDIGRLQAEYDWLDPDDPEKAKVKSQIQSKIYQKKYQEQLQRQLDGILKQMQKDQYLTVSDYLDGCYTDGFVGTIFDLSGQGVPLMMPIDQQSMVHAVQLDSKISHGLYTRLGEDVDLLKKKITAQVSRSIATGESFAQTARQLAGYTSIGYNNAIRIARTEGHRIQTTATMDALYGAKERGADVVKQWDSTLDARTRDSHVKVDGEWKELDEKFSNGLRYPGDPHGKAAEVINCRCALLQRARWALGDGFTKIDGFTDEIKSFDSTETYDEFKKAYFSKENRAYMNFVNELEERYGKDFNTILSKMTDPEYEYFTKLEKARPQFSGMYRGDPIVQRTVPPASVVEPIKGTISTFTPAKTIQEAEEAIKKWIDSSHWAGTGVSYAGISVESANAVNRTLQNLFETFDIENLAGVYVAKGNTKLGKLIDGATAAYSDVRKSLLLNNRALKNVDDIVKSHAEELALVKDYISDPSKYTFKTKRGEAVMKASMKSGRATVPDTIEDVIHHEMGHHIEKVVKSSDGWESIKANMPNFAEGISGYAAANENEYIAESFASYMKGEGIIDPSLSKLFDSLRKDQNIIKTVANNGNGAKIESALNQLAKHSSKDFATIVLPKQEYAQVMSELATHMTDEQRKQPIVKKAIGNYFYTVENNGFGDYRVIGKTPIDGITIDDVWGE